MAGSQRRDGSSRTLGLAGTAVGGLLGLGGTSARLGMVRLGGPRAKGCGPALLRCAEPGQADVATSVLGQTAEASSSNATVSRRFVGTSTASS
jgi:hypothetical protein